MGTFLVRHKALVIEEVIKVVKKIKVKQYNKEVCCGF